jgi:drug/metabolite transporter (DMT)-like permease
MNAKYVRGYTYAMLSAFLYGCAPFWTTLIYSGGGNPFSVVFYRSFFAIPAVFFLMLRTNSYSRLTRLESRKILVQACLSAVTSILLFASYNYINSGLATSLHFVYPLCVLIGSVLFFHDHITSMRATCFIVCTIGIFLLYSPGVTNQPFGITLALASGAAYGSLILYLDKSGLKTMQPFRLAFHLQLFVASIMLIANLVSGTLTLNMTPLAWFSAIVLGNTTCFVGNVLFQMAVRDIGGQHTSLLSTFEPITSIVVSILVFHEPFGPRVALGAGLVLLSVFLLTKFDAPPEPLPAQLTQSARTDCQ